MSHWNAIGSLHELIEAADERRLQRLQKQLTSQDLLIIDELGFVPLSKTGAELLFEIISQRYERGSIVITSNPGSGPGQALPFVEWTEVFGSERLTGTILDRLTHHVVRPRPSNRWRSGPHPRDERRQLPSAPEPNGQKPKLGNLGADQVGLWPTRLATRQLHGEHSCQGAAQTPTEWQTIPPVNGPSLLRD